MQHHLFFRFLVKLERSYSTKSWIHFVKYDFKCIALLKFLQMRRGCDGALIDYTCFSIITARNERSQNLSWTRRRIVAHVDIQVLNLMRKAYLKFLEFLNLRPYQYKFSEVNFKKILSVPCWFLNDLK